MPMLQRILTLSLVGFLIGCQKDAGTDVPPIPPLDTDTVASIVVDGDYGGYAMVDYDSAVLRYAANAVTIQHFTRGGGLIGTETIRYDSTERVTAYRYQESGNTYLQANGYKYSNEDPLPSSVDDTLVIGPDTEIGNVHFMDRDVAGPIKDFSFYSWTQLNNNLPDISHPIVYGTFNQDWHLLVHEIPYEYLSAYFYTAGGDVDSCYTMTTSGDDSYYSAQYTAIDNPLAEVSRRVFKNLAPYITGDLLNSSRFEHILDICFLPSELLTAKVPTRSKSGRSFREVFDENTFQYINRDGALREIAVTHKELASGAVSQTRIRLHY